MASRGFSSPEARDEAYNKAIAACSRLATSNDKDKADVAEILVFLVRETYKDK